MKRRLEEQSSCYKKRTTTNESSNTDNQDFVIEIDDDNEDDSEMLYFRYPSSEYKISSFDKIIKDEKNNNKSASCPKTYKVTINMKEALARPLSTSKIS
jgi:hypothetical protein